MKMFVKIVVVILTIGIVSCENDRDPRCPAQSINEQAIYYSHESDCTKFYQCRADGELILLECPPGLHFNPRINVS